MTDIVSVIKEKAYSEAEKKVYSLARSLKAYLDYEFSNDLKYSGHGKEYQALSNVNVEVVKESQDCYKLNMSIKYLNDNQKELFQFYLNNAKMKALSS